MCLHSAVLMATMCQTYSLRAVKKISSCPSGTAREIGEEHSCTMTDCTRITLSLHRRNFTSVTATTSLEYVSSYFVDLSSDCLAGACMSCDSHMIEFACDTHGLSHDCNSTPSDLVVDGQDLEGRRALEHWELNSKVCVCKIGCMLK